MNRNSAWVERDGPGTGLQRDFHARLNRVCWPTSASCFMPTIWHAKIIRFIRNY